MTPEKPPLQHLVYKSSYPISIYLLLTLLHGLILLSILYTWNFLAMLIYLPIFLILFYIFFTRFSARIEINSGSKLTICYFFPWNKDVTINLNAFKSFDYARGFYDSFDDKRLGYFNFLSKCYDLIIFCNRRNNDQIEFKVNLKMGSFKKMIKFLNKEAKIDLLKLNSSDHFIW